MKINTFIDSLSVKSGLVATLAILALGGCIGNTYPYMRGEIAQRIAAPAWMIKRDITAEPFLLRAYERIHDRGGVAHLYIEGEEPEFLKNSTPFNPVALHLASKDKADNVIYLARPCQYTGMLPPAESCDPKYLGEAQFSEDVINAYDKALNDIVARYDIRNFDLVGYSGGAAIAALLAARRNDISSLRTVSGILDPDVYTQKTGKEPLTDSLNPVSQAADLIKIPQYHFIGGKDDIVPHAVLHSYLQALPPGNCVQTMLIQEVEHDAGWVDKWPELLDLPVICYSPTETAAGNGLTSNAAGGGFQNNAPGEETTLMPPTMPQDIPQTVRGTFAKP